MHVVAELHSPTVGVMKAEVARISRPRRDGALLTRELLRRPSVSMLTKGSISVSLSPRLSKILTGGIGSEAPSEGDVMAPSESGDMVDGSDEEGEGWRQA